MSSPLDGVSSKNEPKDLDSASNSNKSESVTDTFSERSSSSDCSNNSNNERASKAARHWNFLRKAILGEDCRPVGVDGEFTTYHILTIHDLDHDKAKQLQQKVKPELVRKYCMQLKDNATPYTVNVFHENRSLTLTDIKNLYQDNTGSRHLWAAEEALATYILENLDFFHDKSVLELGGGYCCLAGLMVAKYARATEVLLTDGNNDCISEITITLTLNKWQCNEIQPRRLLWEEAATKCFEAKEQFDVILAADCIFFPDQQMPLLDAVCHFLKPDGEALVMAPPRTDGYEQFVEKCQMKGLTVVIHENYSPTVWNVHQRLLLGNEKYTNKMYPQMLLIQKPKDVKNKE